MRGRSWISLVVTLVWFGSMSALVARDVLPAWRAKPIPPVATRELVKRLGSRHQAGIFDGQERRIGTTWSNYVSAAGLLVTTTTAFDRAGLLSGCVIESQIRFTEDDTLDEVELCAQGPGVSIELKGENYDPHFPCELKIGTVVHSFKLDAKAAAMLSDAIRPFHSLPKLEVGTSWTMEVFDLLGAVSQRKARISPVVVKVTGKETIEVGGKRVACFVVESNRVRAWANADGLVLVQEMDLPVIGRMVIRDEAFDESSRIAARQRMRRLRDHE